MNKYKIVFEDGLVYRLAYLSFEDNVGLTMGNYNYKEYGYSIYKTDADEFLEMYGSFWKIKFKVEIVDE